MPNHSPRIRTADQRNEQRVRFIADISKAAKPADRHIDRIADIRNALPFGITIPPEDSALTLHRDEYFLRCMPMQRCSAAFWRPDVDHREAMRRKLDLRREAAVRHILGYAGPDNIDDLAL